MPIGSGGLDASQVIPPLVIGILERHNRFFGINREIHHYFNSNKRLGID